MPGAYKYLKQLFTWCERYNVAVFLQFNGLKGSQTGTITSGNCGACKPKCETADRTQWFNFLQYRKENLAVIANYTATFADSSAFWAFGVANEVANHPPGIESAPVMSFYQEAYNIIRQHCPNIWIVFL